MTPNKVLLRVLLCLLYIWLTIRVIFVEVPPLLREPDTATNTFALVAVVLWVVFSLYAAYYWWYAKNQTKSDKGEKK